MGTAKPHPVPHPRAGGRSWIWCRLTGGPRGVVSPPARPFAGGVPRRPPHLPGVSPRRAHGAGRATGTPPPGRDRSPRLSRDGPGRPAACQPPRRPRPTGRASTKPHEPRILLSSVGNGPVRVWPQKKKTEPGPEEPDPAHSIIPAPSRTLAAIPGHSEPGPAPGRGRTREPSPPRGGCRAHCAAHVLGHPGPLLGPWPRVLNPALAVGRRSALSAAPPVRKDHRRVVSPDHVTFHPAIEITAPEHDAGANTDPRQRLVVDGVLVEGPEPLSQVRGRVWCGQPLPRFQPSLFFWNHPAHPGRSLRRASRAKRQTKDSGPAVKCTDPVDRRPTPPSHPQRVACACVAAIPRAPK